MDLSIFIFFLLILVPLFALPQFARYGGKARVLAGSTLIGFGVCLATILYSSLFFGQKTPILLATLWHLLAVLFMMFIPFGFMILHLLPFLYVGLGIWILLVHRK